MFAGPRKVTDRVLPIRDDLRPEINRHCMLIAYHEQLLTNLQVELARVIRLGMGVDMLQEDGWRLDPVTYLLTHQSDDPGPPPAIVPAEPGLSNGQTPHIPPPAIRDGA